MGSKGFEGWEIGRQIRDDELKEMIGSRHILEALLAHIAQAHAVRQMLLDKVARCLRDQHLTPVPGAHDTCRAVYIHPHISLGSQHWLARMQPHTHTHYTSFGPGVSSQSALRVNRRRDSISGTRKGYEEGISLHIDFVTAPPLECRTQQVPALREHRDVALTQPLEQLRRPLDVGKEQRDRPRGQLAH